MIRLLHLPHCGLKTKTPKRYPIALGQYYIHPVGSRFQNLHVSHPEAFPSQETPSTATGGNNRVPFRSAVAGLRSLVAKNLKTEGCFCFVLFFKQTDHLCIRSSQVHNLWMTREWKVPWTSAVYFCSNHYTKVWDQHLGHFMPIEKTDVIPLAKFNPKGNQISNRIKRVTATKNRHLAPMRTDMITHSDLHLC